MTDKYKLGDVVRYTPQPAFRGQTDTHWCREATALAVEGRDDGVILLDTYWGTMSDAHCLDDRETASAELIFNVGDYDELPRYSRGDSRGQWEKYAPADRAIITSQHRLQARFFVRKGATEDHATKVENARERLREAEDKLDSARRGVDWAQRDLDELLAPVG